MPFDARVSYYRDKYGVFHRLLQNHENELPPIKVKLAEPIIKPTSTWLRLIMMFWNVRVMKSAFRFGVAAMIMNQYERLGLIVFILCFVV